MIISVEGIDGVGKSTFAQALATKLDVPCLHFPDRSTKAGQAIERMLEGPACAKYPEAFQALQLACRLERTLSLKLAEGRYASTTIVCDRFYMSGYVYGGAFGIPYWWWEAITRGTPSADVEILLVGDVDVIDARLEEKGGKDFYETQGSAYLLRLQNAYRDIWTDPQHRYNPEALWIGPLDETHRDVEAIVSQCLALRNTTP
jgi:thymidylate kinase